MIFGYDPSSTATAVEMHAFLERVRAAAPLITELDPTPMELEAIRQERVRASREVIASMARRAPPCPPPARVCGLDIRRFIPRRT